MKTLKFLFVFSIVTFIFIGCKNEVKTETTEIAEIEVSETTEDNAITAKAEFTIEGMTCAMGCAKRIENKLAGMEGVKSAKVDFEKKLAMVEFQEGKITTTSLEETVKGAGDAYSVTEMKTVESFTSSEAKNTKAHECSEKCAKKGCTAEMKAACKKDCTKACCAKKA